MTSLALDQGPTAPPLRPWADAVLAAALLAIDPRGTGGAVVRARPGPVRDRWLAILKAALPAAAPVRRLPPHIRDDRLLGGLDLAATLAAGRPVVERGLLAATDGGLMVVAMAERLSVVAAAQIGRVLDCGEVVIEREGVSEHHPARFGLVALDEGSDDNERPPAALVDRLAFLLDLTPVGYRDLRDDPGPGPEIIREARARLPAVEVREAEVRVLCATAAALGIGSLRAPVLALRAARAAAALADRAHLAEDDLALAARLVLAPRACALPAPLDPAEPDPPSRDTEPPPPQDDDNGTRDPTPNDQTLDDKTLEELVLAAAQAAIPPGLLDQLRAEGGAKGRARSAGKSGAFRRASARGRPAGTRPGEPRRGARLDVLATLRAAAPWQTLRRRVEASPPAGSALATATERIRIRRDDFRIVRLKQRARTATVFLVDASGSAALHRLAEAKGAVELLLAECYVRRDQVALLAFRGRGADLLLPPTRSLVRAKRCLAGLPGGGGTPLAAGLDAAWTLTEAIRRRGDTPGLVLLTDGRANIARDGRADRQQAARDVEGAAQMIRRSGLKILVVDTSPRPQGRVQELAKTMAGQYLPLPHANAAVLAEAARPGAP